MAQHSIQHLRQALDPAHGIVVRTLYRSMLKTSKQFGEQMTRRRLNFNAEEIRDLCSVRNRLQNLRLSTYHGRPMTGETALSLVQQGFRQELESPKSEPLTAINDAFSIFRLLTARTRALATLPLDNWSETITDCCKVRIESRYRAFEFTTLHFLFEYHVQIQNLSSDRPIQLVSRRLNFENSNGEVMNVEGSGVIGQHPRIEPGGTYTYSSFVTIATPLGAMGGAYQIIDIKNGKNFDAEIGKILFQA